MNRQGLYFIYNPYTGLVKIGISNNVQARIASLERAAGVRLELLSFVDDAAAFELELHDAFYASRAVGEWFEPTEELLLLARCGSPTTIFAFVEGKRPEITARIQERERLAEEARLTRARERTQLKRELAAKERQRVERALKRKERAAQKAEEEREKAFREVERAKQEWQSNKGALLERHGLRRESPRHPAIPVQRMRNLQFVGARSGVARQEAR
jgi:hypothetical protein